MKRLFLFTLVMAVSLGLFAGDPHGHKGKCPHDAKAKGEHSCPTIGIEAIDSFHGVLHTMHMGVNKGDYAPVKKNIADMQKKSAELIDYMKKCCDDSKCETTKEKHKAMAKMAKQVSKSVNKLAKTVAKGSDKELETAFNQVHENFYAILSNLKDCKVEHAKTTQAKCDKKHPVTKTSKCGPDCTKPCCQKAEKAKTHKCGPDCKKPCCA